MRVGGNASHALRSVVAIVVGLALARCAAAQEIYVPAQYSTIQTAIDACPIDGVVIIAPGTYRGPGNRDISFRGKAITVRSMDPNDPAVVGATIIDCQGGGEEPHRGFQFTSSEGPDTVVSGLTIRGGHAPDEQTRFGQYGAGGAIACLGSSPTITHCVIDSNTADLGGAVYGFATGAVMQNCVIRNNEALAGGAIFCDADAHITMMNCTVSDNRADDGGAVCALNSSPRLLGCDMRGNVATYYGGGLYLSGAGAEISACTIIANLATDNVNSRGGGIYCDHGDPVIVNTILEKNRAGVSGGGGIYCGDDASPTIVHCVFSGNSAKKRGGGLYCAPGNGPARPTIRNSIFSNNIAGQGPDIGLYSAYATVAIDHCNLRGAETAIFAEMGGTVEWGAGNIDADPGFYLPGDYHLRTDSPCVDSGVDAGIAADADGRVRPVGGGFDMGAYERNDLGPLLAVGPDVLPLVAIRGKARSPIFPLHLANCSAGSLTWSLTGSASWLRFEPASGTATDDIQVVSVWADLTGLSAGDYEGTIVVRSPEAGNSPRTITVPLSIDSDVWVCDSDGADFLSIQAAIDAMEDGDPIVVCPGLYRENIRFSGKQVILRSHDPDDPATVAATIIDGGQAGPVVTFDGTEPDGAVLEGMTLRNGRALEGGGILGAGTRATIRRCVIIENTADARGGGLFACNGTIANCIIAGNGGAECQAGGGLYGCSGLITNCLIMSNEAVSGGGLAACGGTIANCVVSANRAATGGAMSGCDGQVWGCTVIGNRATGGVGGGFHGCNGTIANSVIWGNIAASQPQLSVSSVPSYCCIQNWSGGGTGNISSQPLFASRTYGVWDENGVAGEDAFETALVDSSANWHRDELVGRLVRPDDALTRQFLILGNTSHTIWVLGNASDVALAGRTYEILDYHIQDISPCRDAGDPAGAYTGQTDLDGHQRILMGRVDIGADEFAPRGDFDFDGDVDLEDFVVFQRCFSGPNRSPTQTGCSGTDFDADGDVDLVDFMAFEYCFNGPNRIARGVRTPEARPPADFDMDGDVDLADFARFQMCVNGPNRPAAQPGCGIADLDADGDVDALDVGVINACFNGPNRPAGCK